MTKETIELLEEYLKSAKEIVSKFNSNDSDAKKRNVDNDFQNKILSILDNIYTSQELRKRSYFPRPEINENIESYLSRGKLKKEKQLPKKVSILLNKAYHINSENDYALSFLTPHIKHRDPNNFGEIGTRELNYNLISNHPSPVTEKSDGSISLMGGCYTSSSR